ncbi:unnamed protein product [Periconia digitata]|uniref:Uncharacterized protein n=1 Tax=Periconia digitata TaxID=1303443 RepID=A0A9W4UCY9_9PLEO|nr:unnamed protein product [Periconia digitata]
MSLAPYLLSKVSVSRKKNHTDQYSTCVLLGWTKPANITCVQFSSLPQQEQYNSM